MEGRRGEKARDRCSAGEQTSGDENLLGESGGDGGGLMLLLLVDGEGDVCGRTGVDDVGGDVTTTERRGCCWCCGSRGEERSGHDDDEGLVPNTSGHRPAQHDAMLFSPVIRKLTLRAWGWQELAQQVTMKPRITGMCAENSVEEKPTSPPPTYWS